MRPVRKLQKNRRGKAVRQKVEWDSGAKREKKVLKAKKPVYADGEIREIEKDHEELPMHYKGYTTPAEAKAEAKWAMQHANDFLPGTAWQVVEPYVQTNRFDPNKKAREYAVDRYPNEGPTLTTLEHIPAGTILTYIGQGYLQKRFYKDRRWKVANEVTNVFLYGAEQVVLLELRGLQLLK